MKYIAILLLSYFGAKSQTRYHIDTISFSVVVDELPFTDSTDYYFGKLSSINITPDTAFIAFGLDTIFETEDIRINVERELPIYVYARFNGTILRTKNIRGSFCEGISSSVRIFLNLKNKLPSNTLLIDNSSNCGDSYRIRRPDEINEPFHTVSIDNHHKP